MIQKETVVQLVEEWMQETSFFLVEVRVSADNEIVVEFESEAEGITIDDCVDLNRFIESRLDREVEDYALEVGSAGIGQPFKVLKQFQINVGEDVEVVLKSGQKFSGVLVRAEEEAFAVTVVRKVKLEGSRKAMSVEAEETYSYADVKSVKSQLRFS